MSSNFSRKHNSGSLYNTSTWEAKVVGFLRSGVLKTNPIQKHKNISCGHGGTHTWNPSYWEAEENSAF